MTAADTDARARESAAGLTNAMRRMIASWSEQAGFIGHGNTQLALEARGLVEEYDVVTYASGGRSARVRLSDLGRAVARVLASGDVDRG